MFGDTHAKYFKLFFDEFFSLGLIWNSGQVGDPPKTV